MVTVTSRYSIKQRTNSNKQYIWSNSALLYSVDNLDNFDNFDTVAVAWTRPLLS